MGKDSKISWCHHTFNPWWGCHKVSEACTHCYAEGVASRFAPEQCEWKEGGRRRFFGLKHWSEPLKWDRKAEATGERPLVFYGSMCDVFEDHPDLPVWRYRLWELIRETQNLQPLLLTKRIENVPEMLPDDIAARVWLGVTVENQARAEERLPLLMQTQAALRFASYEPALERLETSPDTAPYLYYNDLHDGAPVYRGPDWWICGGESGPGARPMHPQWARDLRDQCGATGTPFLFKQWGEWAHWDQLPAEEARLLDANGHGPAHGDDPDKPFRVGKKHAGRLLDGELWDQYPGVKS